MQTFDEPALRFSIAIPDDWVFLPAAWSPMELLKRTDGVGDWIQLANKPFCCARQHHDNPGRAFPTLQATCRPMLPPSEVEARQLLESVLANVEKQWGAVEVEQATTDAIFGGHRANLLRARFAMEVLVDGEWVRLDILSRSVTVFAPQRSFVLGLASSADPDYYLESDFTRILESLRIGR